MEDSTREILDAIFASCTNDNEKKNLASFMTEQYGDNWVYDMIVDQDKEIESGWQTKILEIEFNRKRTVKKIWEEKEENGIRELFKIYDQWPKVLKDLCDWSAKTQNKKQPELAIHAALSSAAGVLSRRYKTTTGIPASLYCLTMGMSGQGKEHGLQTVKACLHAAEDSFRLCGEPASAGGIFDILLQPARTMILDEFAEVMEGWKDRRSAKAAVKKELLKIFNNAGTRYYTDVYSKKGKSDEDRKTAHQQEAIWNPEFNIFSTTIPNAFFSVATTDTSVSGLLNRFLVLFSTMPRQVGRDTDEMPLPRSWSEWARLVKQRWRTDANGFSDNPHTQANVVRLSISEGAGESIKQFREKLLDVQNGLEEQGLDDFFARTDEKALRVALIMQLLKDFDSTEIEADSMDWAIKYVWHCDDQFFKRSCFMMADSPYERMRNKFLGKIRSAGKRGLTRKQMNRTRPFCSMPARDRNALLQDLVDAQLIGRLVNTTLAGREEVVYYALK